MILILGQGEDDILYFVSRFTTSNSVDELPGNIRVYRGSFGIEDMAIAATGYGNMITSAVTAMLIDNYDPYLVVNIGPAVSLSPDMHQGDLLVVDRYYFQHVRYSPFFATNYGQFPNQPSYFLASNDLNKKAEEAGYAFNEAYLQRGYLLSGTKVMTAKKQYDAIKQKHYASVQSLLMGYDTSSGGIAFTCYSRHVSLLSVRVLVYELDHEDQFLTWRRKCLEAMPKVGHILAKILMDNRQDFNAAEELFYEQHGTH